MERVLGLSTQIVTTLRKYGAVPVEFLAKVLGRQSSELVGELEHLENEGVLQRRGDEVALRGQS